jgi:DNA polymerase III subunit gamma/tau
VALDTKYRPRKYGDVLGQDSSVLILRQLLKEGKGYHQSYVFCGQHGSGKTTMGRILARALLCSAPVDGEPCDSCESCLAILQGKQHECFTELDAATKSTKEDMLKITEDIQYSSFSGKRRIYLFDESHRLSKSALDALLKPMEDCVTGTEDKQLVCIFCTTEPEKMQPTIFSRCAPAFVIKAATPAAIANRLAWVCTQEGITYDHDALVTIAEVTECHIRDALKTLEGVSVLGPVNLSNTSSYLGMGSNESILDMLLALSEDKTRALRIGASLTDSSPTSIYERITEAALYSYKFHIGVSTIPIQWNQTKIKVLSNNPDLAMLVANKFSNPPKKPSHNTLLLDLASAFDSFHNPIQRSPQESQSAVSHSQKVAHSVSNVDNSGKVGSNDQKPAKPSVAPVVAVDPRAVGSGSASRKNLEPKPNSVSSSQSLDSEVFRNVFSFHYGRLKDEPSQGHKG